MVQPSSTCASADCAADAFDPFADDVDFFFEEGDDIPPDPSPHPPAPAKAGYRDTTLPAHERISCLFEAMSARRRMLMDLLRYAQSPRRAEEVVSFVDALQEHDYAVYTASDYTRLLEEAGALAKVDEAGERIDPDARRMPDIIVGDDGRRYYKPADIPATFWQTTEDGIAALKADAPLDRLAALLEKEAAYRTIYRRVLDLCAADGGASTAEIAHAVDDDPLVQEPRLMAPHFTNRLEQCDAIRWDGRWKTTSVDEEALGHSALKNIR